jgi:hypothetical protein
MKLNKDQQKSILILNSMSEKIFRFCRFHQIHYEDWLLKLGRNIEYKDIKDVDFKTDAFDFVEIKHRIN